MRLNGIFKDNMVFQQGREIRVFGVVDVIEGNSVDVCIKNGSEVLTQGSTHEIYDDGFFFVVMPELDYGGPYTLEVRANADSADAQVTINEVYIGEVWIAGGQSNMEYPLGRSEFASRVVTGCPETNLHYYFVPVADRYDDAQREAEINSKWVRINKDTCYDMSAVAFYFARRIEEYLAQNKPEVSEVHVGIIGCFWGGTSIACWQSVESLESTEAGRKFLSDFEDDYAEFLSEGEYLKELYEYKETAKTYEHKVQEILKDNPYKSYFDVEQQIGAGPWPPPVGPESERRPGALFEAMVLRLVPFNIKGVIFYQGEEDADRHCNDYAEVFKSLIDEWREIFWDENLPFVFCQLPMYTTRDRKYMGYDDMKWPKLRAQQQLVANTVHDTYMAVLSDCGEFDNVHPVDKKTPGERLATLALRFVYGFEELPAIAPYVIDVRRGDGVEVSFSGDFTNLNLQSVYSTDESGFELAGDDKEFYPADAAVDFDGKTVLVSCKNVAEPCYVRYAFFSYGSANLISDTGLAAAPFEASLDRSISNYY